MSCPTFQILRRTSWCYRLWSSNLSLPCLIDPFRAAFFQRRFLCQKSNEFILVPSEITSGLIIPVIDKQFIETNKEQIQNSVNARKSGFKELDVSQFLQICDTLVECKRCVAELEKQKENNTQEHKSLREKGMSSDHPEVRSLTENGRNLRTKCREAEKTYNDLFNKAMKIFIQIPNMLHFDTPIQESQVFKRTVSTKKVREQRISKQYPKYIHDNESKTIKRTSDQIPVFRSQTEEIQLAFKAQKILANAGYIGLSPPDLIRRSVIYSMELDNQQFRRLVAKDEKKRGPAYMTYLCGTSSLPSLIALLSKSVIQASDAFPIKYVVTGKSHNLKQSRNYDGDQNCVVQCLIACTSDSSTEVEFNNLASLMESFYVEEIGVEELEICSLAAPMLESFEKKKFQFVDNTNDVGNIMGEISLIGDHLSKKLISCYKNEKGKYVFVKYVHAVFLDATSCVQNLN